MSNFDHLAHGAALHSATFGCTYELFYFKILRLEEDLKMAGTTFKGTGPTLEQAIDAAHAQVPVPPGSADFPKVSKVVAFGKSSGNLAGVNEFWVEVEAASPQT